LSRHGRGARRPRSLPPPLGHRLGFWNPAIYRFATRHGSPFTPLDTASNGNTNLFYTGTPGQAYNVGSGLGTPNFAQLAADFAH
jgi:kumamolisin